MTQRKKKYLRLTIEVPVHHVDISHEVQKFWNDDARAVEVDVKIQDVQLKYIDYNVVDWEEVQVKKAVMEGME